MRTIGATAAGAAALAILAGGCGGAGAAGPGAADGAATIVPSDALAFAAASTDLSSSDWHGLGPLALRQLQISADEVVVKGPPWRTTICVRDSGFHFSQPVMRG